VKGTSFQKPLELQLVIEGESWHQGDRVAGTLRVRNHGPEPVPMGEMRVVVAHGADKKVKAKAPDGFTVVETIQPAKKGETLAPGAQSAPLPWEYRIDVNGPISDANGSLYVLYGRGETPSGLGNLQLIVKPNRHFLEILEVLAYTFKFVTKATSAAKGGAVEAALAPPTGRAHASVTELLLTLRLEKGQAIDARFAFDVNELDASKGGIALKRAVKEFRRTLTPEQYLLSFNQRLNKDAVEKVIEGVFEELKKIPKL